MIDVERIRLTSDECNYSLFLDEAPDDTRLMQSYGPSHVWENPPTCSELRSMRPATASRKVDFPAPDGPITAITWEG